MAKRPQSSSQELEAVERALTRYDHLGDDQDLDQAIQQCNRSLKSRLDPAKSHRWMVLHCRGLQLRFERDANMVDLEQARSALRALLESISPGTSVHIYALYIFGRLFEALYDYCGSRESIEESYDYYRQAMVSATEGNHGHTRLSKEIAIHMSRILVGLMRLFKDKPEYITEAVDLLFDSLRGIDDSDPAKALALGTLCEVYYERWHFGDRSTNDDLLKSARCGREALRLAPSHRSRQSFLRFLSKARRDTNTEESVKESIELAEQAMQLMRENPPIRFSDKIIVEALALAQASMFGSGGRLEDLNCCIGYFRLLMANMEVVRRPSFTFNYCLSLCLRFAVTGQLVDIDDAIEGGYKAINMESPSPTMMDKALFNLACAHALRFAHSNEDTDFHAAQMHFQRVEQNCEQNEGSKDLLPVSLQMLARMLYTRFEQDLDLDSLNLAIDYGARAVALSADNARSPEKPSFCSELGGYLAKRSVMCSSSHDLIRSISMHEAALAFSSISAEATYERHLLLWRYAHSLRLRFELHGDPSDFENCIKALEDALDRATAAHHQKQSLYLTELALAFAGRHRHYKSQGDLDAALQYFRKAAQTVEGFSGDRFQAAVAAARLAHEQGQLTQATTAFSEAVAFLPRIAWLGLTTTKRYAKLVRRASQLACDAAASAVMCMDLVRAVELLDEGRSVIWRSVLELRTDLTMLESSAPQLAQELLELGQALEHDDVSSGPVPETHAEERAQHRRRIAERWDFLVDKVRELEGFHAFLKPLPFSVLRQAAADGPIVILNVSEYRSDAIIVTASDPLWSIPLPGLSLSIVKRLAYVFLQALGMSRDQQGYQFLESVMLDTARNLWEGGLLDVARSLTDWQPQKHEPLHVWWVPTGFLSLLPVHCAGPFEKGKQGIPELFISSYTTTLSALLRAQKRTSAPTRNTHRMLAIAQPWAPGLPHLPHADTEMQILTRNPQFRDSSSILFGAEATISAVTQAFHQHNWIHACCHGHWNPVHPLESAFHLIDGSMTLSHIVQMRLSDSQFAFLSACHTGRHSTVLPDESMSLAAGLQIAGIRGVLATAWGMADRDGPLLTQHFYERLTVGGRLPDPKHAAEALHWAIDQLRRSGVPLCRWGAFFHIGI